MTISLVLVSAEQLMSTLGLSLQHSVIAPWTLFVLKESIKPMSTFAPLSILV